MWGELKKPKSLYEKVEALRESRRQKCNAFVSLKESLAEDNVELTKAEEDVRETIASFESLLTNIQLTRESNDRTIQEISKIVG